MKKGSKHTEETREKIRLAKLGKKYGPMSDENKEKIRKATLGKKKIIINSNPSWFDKGHIPIAPFKKGHKPWNEGKMLTDSRAGKKYKLWRKAVLDRDGHKCVKCANTNRLHAHHIVPWKQQVELRFEIDNGQTLCNSCHSKTETTLSEVGKNFRFVKGHKLSEHSLRKIADANLGRTPWNKGKKCPEQLKERLRNLNLGRTPWNKGLKGLNFSPATQFKKGIVPWNKGMSAPSPDKKCCKDCKEVKNIDQFTPQGKWRTNRCKSCRNKMLTEKRKKVTYARL